MSFHRWQLFQDWHPWTVCQACGCLETVGCRQGYWVTFCIIVYGGMYPYHNNQLKDRPRALVICDVVICVLLCVTGSSCPVHYYKDAGDVPGWGSIQSLPSINNVVSCARHCDVTSGCCSFEYSPTEMKCNLNRECRPTKGAYKDYAFYVKGNSNTQSLIPSNPKY